MVNKKRQTSPAEGLLAQREAIVQNILRFKKAMQEKTISLNHIELECRLEILNSYIDEAMEVQRELDQERKHPGLRAELEDICVSTKALFLSNLSMRKKSNAHDTSMVNQSSHAKLPQMKLPKFSGKYAEFKNFIGLFESLVDEDPTLSNIEKFSHLLSCLSEEALGTVKAFQVTDANYPKALESLKRVYDNTCLIFFDHISKLFSLDSISTPSAAALRSLVDNVSAIYESLLSIADNEAILNAILIYLVTSKVDSITKTKWEESIDYDKLPTWKECQAVLNKRCQHIAADEASSPTSNKAKPKQQNGSKNNAKSALPCAKGSSPNTSNSKDSTSKESKCLFCNSSEHWITNCSSFNDIAVSNRYEFAKKSALCLNCLRKGHGVPKCKSSNCRICKRAHHTLLHFSDSKPDPKANPVRTPSLPLAQDQPSSSAMNVNINTVDESQVLLATAVVNLRSKSGELISARVLLDSCSQTNFMTEELCQKLQLKKEKSILNLVGIGQTTAASHYKTFASVISSTNSFEYSTEFWILRSISSFQPLRFIPTGSVHIPKNLPLADPDFNKPQKIDLLLGAEVFFDILCVGQFKSAPHLPTLQKTLFGWIVSGKYQCKNSSQAQASSCVSIAKETVAIDSFIEKFWEMEELPRERRCPTYTQEQMDCERHFAENVCRLPTGRFQVALPFKASPAQLGKSYEAAKRRLQSLERKLVKTPENREMYRNFMKEYISLGHMSLLTGDIPKNHYFIPHQCVIRPESMSTKLRVVFDASAKTTTNVSLNEILMTGPTIQPELYDTLLRFRLNKYAITADITKMYRQVDVVESDRKFQLILWREFENQPIQLYQLNTVTYGTTPAPFLAIRCLNLAGELCQTSYPIGSKIIRNCFYVDDLLSGAETFEELEAIRREVSGGLESAGFQLAKWFSNHQSYEKTEFQLQLNEAESTKTLGIRWLPIEDIFKFTLAELPDLPTTKRNILSIASRLFDPLGLLSPLIIRSKVLLQELWLKKLDWDESVPIHIETRWRNFKLNLQQIDSVRIPRFVNTSKIVSCQIHGFADASSRAYGCCIYVRTTSQLGSESRLLTAKSRVAPLKSQSLPRLELCAAHLLAKLWDRISPLLDVKIDSVHFWTDSEITLHWIKSHPSALNVFVANRVSEIQEWTKQVLWRHVPSQHNPADVVSRGCDVADLQDSIWFNGPKFLSKEMTCWPQNPHFKLTKEQEELEKRKENFTFVSLTTADNHILTFVTKFSCYTTLIRTLAFAFRWAYKKPKGKPLTAAEIRFAFLKLVSVIQQHEYPEEMKKLKSSKTLTPCIQKLNPFLHEIREGKAIFSLIRVGGRLLNAPLPYNAKFPLLLPKNCHFLKIYLRHLHISNCHAGAKALMAFLRQDIWVINARQACTKTVRSCILCFKYKPKLLTQIMGNLPADRLSAVRPFLVCEVDFCGPVNATLKIRGRPPVKMYIAVYVCFASKAIHLELVSDLSSDCFILSFERFVGRRGLPTKVFCDNGKNFVGADRQLRELITALATNKNNLSTYAANLGTEFVFIPPRAPHFGGLWEAAVKSAKHRLVRAIGSALLTPEELNTLLVEVEAVLNSRPIAPNSDDPNDGTALTPAHLLIGQTLRPMLPGCTENESDNKTPYSRKWQLICALKRKFWRDWSRDYLLSLQQRSKWIVSQPNVTIGSMVLLEDENAPPQQWAVGRVISVTPGSDGKVRVVVVKTATGEFKRPIHRLALLPMS